MIDPSRYTHQELERLAISQDALIRSLEAEVARLQNENAEIELHPDEHLSASRKVAADARKERRQ